MSTNSTITSNNTETETETEIETETGTETHSVSRTYGWVRDLPSNENNFLSSAHPSVIRTFPKEKFLSNLSYVYDQGRLGSCTANALGSAFEYAQINQNLEDFIPSRLFIYYNERDIEGTIKYDSGAALSDGIKSLTDLGVCPETIWPYDISKFAEKPSLMSYMNASTHQVMASRRVPITIDGFKTMINMGYPVSFGFTVYNSFETQEVANTGIMPMPGPNEKPIGGHAVLCIGYDDTMKSADGKNVGFLLVRNSWSESWGKKGNFYMPYAYITSGLVSDLWVITKNEEPMVKLNKQLSMSIETIGSRIAHFCRGVFSQN